MAAARVAFLPAGGLLVVLWVVALSLQSVPAVNATSLLSVVDYSKSIARARLPDVDFRMNEGICG